MQRIFCPKHKERTPSVVIYDTHAYCYGGCGRIELSDLGSVYQQSSPTLPPVDLIADIERINSLPRASIRGLSLPVDGDSYYIVWPEGTYYKRRKFFAEDGSKYLCPRGHKKPLLIAHNPKGADTLAITEGEINSLSLATLNPSFAICSPGGVGDFKESLTNSLHFARYLLILDKDRAGLEAAIRTRELLIKKTPYVEVFLMEKDCNQLLQEGKLHEEAKRLGWLDL